MNKRKRALLSISAILGVFAVLAKGTPIVGLLVGTILSTGNTSEQSNVNVHVALPAVANAAAQDEPDEWVANFHTTGPTSFIVQDVVYAPGGHTGWHSHPGILLSSVISGSIEWYDARCNKHVYNAGDGLTESTQNHYVRNAGNVNAHFMVTYAIAKGQPRRIDEPAPACAAGLGLE